MVQKGVANFICMSWGFPKFPYQPRWTIKNFRNEAPGNLGAWGTFSAVWGGKCSPKSVLPRESRFSGVVVTIFEKCQHVFGGLRRHVVFFSEISIKWWFLKDCWKHPISWSKPSFLGRSINDKWWNFTKQILGGKKFIAPRNSETVSDLSDLWSFWAARG